MAIDINNGSQINAQQAAWNARMTSSMDNLAKILEQQAERRTPSLSDSYARDGSNPDGVSGGTYAFDAPYNQSPGWVPFLTFNGGTGAKALILTSSGLPSVGGAPPQPYLAPVINLTIGVLARISMSLGSSLRNTFIVDVPANGYVTVPFVGTNVQVDLMLGFSAFTPSIINANFGGNTLDLDHPRPQMWDPTQLVQLYQRITVGGALANAAAVGRTSETLPSRQASVSIPMSGGSFNIAVPRGTQSLYIAAPDGAFLFARDIPGNLARTVMTIPPATHTSLPIGSTYIECDSSGGGYFNAFFYLGC